MVTQYLHRARNQTHTDGHARKVVKTLTPAVKDNFFWAHNTMRAQVRGNAQLTMKSS